MAIASKLGLVDASDRELIRPSVVLTNDDSRPPRPQTIADQRLTVLKLPIDAIKKRRFMISSAWLSLIGRQTLNKNGLSTSARWQSEGRTSKDNVRHIDAIYASLYSKIYIIERDGKLGVSTSR